MICWIHGAHSTGQVFNYLLEHVPPHDHCRFEYDTRTPLATNIALLTDFMAEHDATMAVGHSLGGLMAAVLMRREMIERGATIASPLGGLFIANFFPMVQILSDVRSTAPLVSDLRNHQFDDRFLNITAAGLNRGYTDGVVPLWSQNALRGVKRSTVETNHYEVMLSPKVAQMISDHMFD